MANNNKITGFLTTKKQLESERKAEEETQIKDHKIHPKGQQFVRNGLPDELSKNWNPPGKHTSQLTH